MIRAKICKRSVGINFNDQKQADISVWAPYAKHVEILLPEKPSIALEKDEFGYWSGRTDTIKEGELYKIRLDNEKELPDPASLSQPDGVHGFSRAIDLSNYRWQDNEWQNIPLEEYIIYEVHTGTFTDEGTFEALSSKLDYLKELGITALEIMPVAQFPGTRNWGYDGVYPFAVQNSYGGAKELQKLVDACHSKGLAVVLDVVYNHLGPEGNYLGNFGPYFTDKYHTPWGSAINFDDWGCDAVRNYFIENVLMWFRDFHFDALRLDAVHAIKDFSPVHILREIKLRVNELNQETGRRHYLIIENDLNDNRFINPLEEQGYGMDAQWIDEFHHALRIVAGGAPTGYFADFNGIDHLAKAYRDAYVYDGQYSPQRCKTFGIKAENNPGHQFIVFSQNHDQVGNRMLGERTSSLMSFEMQKLLAGAVIFSPFIPLLFMAEEWSEPHPFQYFVSHTDLKLAEAVRKGRTEEFAAFHNKGQAPDPMAEETFDNSKLQWDLLGKEPHRTMFNYYRQLIALRKQQPALKHLNRNQLSVKHDEKNKTLILYRWFDSQKIMCLLNFSATEQPVEIQAQFSSWFKLIDSASPEWKGPKASPDEISSYRKLNLPPESFLVYYMHRQLEDDEAWQMLGHS
ncbi:malto-oligosyltrehalose trehalohydrolase [Pedobacter sp. P351]|uniref:malto-oligosyltrehalose trehalohydrolase n=1 Tax=Pedobacter superstes TaxID=3133441 RepID=UPI003098B86E